MKHVFCNFLLMSAAMLTTTTAGAQVFEQQPEEFLPLHRGTATVADYNQDGFDDIYYGGANWLFPQPPEGEVNDGSYFYNWSAYGVLLTGQGDGKFTAKYSNPNDQDGFGANGLLPLYWNVTRWLDVDNDGQLDVLTGGKSECGVWAGEDPDYIYQLVYRNLGAERGYQFEIVPASGLLQAMDMGRNDNSYGAKTVAIGDYDGDGLQDIALLGERHYKREPGDEENQWERFVRLFRNQGDGTFQDQRVFNPLPYDVNPRAEALFEIDEATFEPVATRMAAPVSNGSIRFADLNGDGLLDLVYTGWRDGNFGGGCFYIYKNLGNGEFEELTIDTDVFVGCYESELAIADFNGDGWLDILSLGTPNQGDKRADVYLNTGMGDFTFVRSDVDGGNGLYGLSAAAAEAVDVNNDGLVDVIATGWTPVNDLGWGSFVFMQNPDNTFTAETSGFGLTESGSFALGDFYGRNVKDVFSFHCGWDGDWKLESRIYKNVYGENTLPEAPTGVEATYADGRIVVRWEAGSDAETAQPALAYNVSVRNRATGWTAQLLPANLETGRLLTYRDVQTLVRSEENVLTFAVSVPEGDYEVGVQTVDLCGAASPFATTTYASAIRSLTEDGSGAEAPTYNLAGQRVSPQASGLLVQQGRKIVRK